MTKGKQLLSKTCTHCVLLTRLTQLRMQSQPADDTQKLKVYEILSKKTQHAADDHCVPVYF